MKKDKTQTPVVMNSLMWAKSNKEQRQRAVGLIEQARRLRVSFEALLGDYYAQMTALKASEDSEVLLNIKYYTEICNMEYAIKLADFAHELDKCLKNPYVIQDLAQKTADFYATLEVGEEEML